MSPVSAGRGGDVVFHSSPLVYVLAHSVHFEVPGPVTCFGLSGFRFPFSDQQFCQVAFDHWQLSLILQLIFLYFWYPSCCDDA